MRFFTLMIIACSLFCYTGPARASKNLTFVSEEWEGRTNADGTGFYWDLLRAIYEPAGYTLQFSVMPYARAVKMVVDGQAHGYVASYIDEEEVIYPQTAFDTDKVAGVFRKGELDPAQGQNALEGRNVGWIRGYNYDAYLDVPVVKNELNSRESGLQMVERGRLDVYLDAAVDIRIAMEQDVVDRNQLEKALFLELKLYMAFQNGETGRYLAKVWDDRMKELHDNGELRTLYSQDPDAWYPF
jgi:polar amino acid transport system substrate-binding protein